ncbi:unnamed protein product, partial [Ranitomeya imitator]
MGIKAMAVHAHYVDVVVHYFNKMASDNMGPEAAVDFRSWKNWNYTNLINDETIDSWRQKVIDNSNSNTIKNDEHFRTSPKIPGLDMLSIKVLFEKLMSAHHSRLLEQILKSFESFLIPQLPSSPPDVEAMRIYLILPEFPLLKDSKYYVTLTLPLAMAILRLDTNPSKVLGTMAFITHHLKYYNWWSQICPNYFFRLIDLYKGAVVYLLNGRKTLLIPVLFTSYITAALRLLEKLHKKVGPTIMQDSVTICSYPFVFDAQAKTKMLQTDAELQMQVAINGANLQNVFMLLSVEPMLAKNPYLVLHVRRTSLVSDALRELSIHSDIDLKKPLKVWKAGDENNKNLLFISLTSFRDIMLWCGAHIHYFDERYHVIAEHWNKLLTPERPSVKQRPRQDGVIFDGEEAVDDGGVTKEFFLLLLKELLNPIYGMFTVYPDSNLIWFSDIVSASTYY